MTERPRLIVFDCDGTLVDSQASIHAAMAYAWERHGLGAAPAPEAVRRIVGLPLIEAIALLHPDGEPGDHRALDAHYREEFLRQRTRPDHVEPLFEGAREALAAVRAAGFLTGVATGKSRRGLLATLDRHGLLDAFDVLKTADDGPGKPNPAILTDAMGELGVGASDTVMIGDTTYDILMARAAGAHALGVAWGYHPPEELHAAGAHGMLGAYGELAAGLERLWKE